MTKNKNIYFNHEIYRRITENKAKPIKFETSQNQIYKSQAEFGPWYSQQLHHICQFLSIKYIFWPGIIASVNVFGADL